MIHTRQTIFDTLKRLFKRLFKQADENPIGFKNAIYAVILNDMKEWVEYQGEDRNIEEILNKFLICHPEFSIVRLKTNLFDYKNVNTPQSNTAWSRIFDDFDNSKRYYAIKVKRDGDVVIELNEQSVRLTEDLTYTIPSTVTSKNSTIVIVVPNGIALRQAINDNESSIPTADGFDENITELFVREGNKYTLTLTRPLSNPIKLYFKYE